MKKAIFLILTVCVCFFAYTQKTIGNAYLRLESKMTHTFQLHLGYNRIVNNNSINKEDLVGFPIGISYELCKNGMYYGKIKYTNFSIVNDDFTNSYYQQNGDLVTDYTSYKQSNHLLSFTLGLVNNVYPHKFQIGAVVGAVYSVYKTDQTTYNPSKDTVFQSTDDNEMNAFIGVELGYKYFLTENISLGVEGMCGYVFGYKEPACSIGAVVGYTLFNRKNYRF